MDMGRLNWKLFGLVVVFMLLYGAAYLISLSATRLEGEERDGIVTAIESSVDRVYELTEQHALELASDSTLHQVLLGQVKPKEVMVSSNGGEGLFLLWKKNGEVVIQEGMELGILPSPYPVNERILLIGRRKDTRPCLVVGCVEPVKSEDADIGFIGFYTLVSPQDFGLGDKIFEVYTPTGEQFYRVGHGLAPSMAVFAYAVTDGAGQTAAVVKAALSRPWSSRNLVKLFGTAALVGLVFLGIGLFLQFFLGLFGFGRAEK